MVTSSSRATFLRRPPNGPTLEPMAEGNRRQCQAVLVVDDDPDVREALADSIARTGRTVLGVGDGSEALSVLEAGTVPRPCLVFLDLMMAPMDGCEFLERLDARDDADQLPVLVVSANPESLPGDLRRRVLGSLRKPFGVEELLAVLDRHC